eukprot:TRINITY_DN621_c0_g1_i1.p1 TRINITY_DN621_c0_g1~~TRINITY_DN621_c0_g1_i1.p1  ORF type:complete len:685 (-),score=246.37 TRINITY_DN621_c0_g1_i1:94-2148(-)
MKKLLSKFTLKRNPDHSTPMEKPKSTVVMRKMSLSTNSNPANPNSTGTNPPASPAKPARTPSSPERLRADSKAEKLKQQIRENLEQRDKEDEQDIQKKKEEAEKLLQEELKKLEQERNERMKKFLAMREAAVTSDAASANSENKASSEEVIRKRRAHTLASAPPVDRFFKPAPEIVTSAPEVPKVATASAKKERTRRPKISPSPQTLERHVPEVSLPEALILGVGDIFDQGLDHAPNMVLLTDHFYKEGKITNQAAITILNKAEDILRKEPNLLELEAPITVVGDIHGQYYDLVNLIDQSGDPENTQYLFLGDYVDRGSYGMEVTLLLMAYKIKHPYTFFMLRGNHESRLLTSHFNFRLEAFTKYSGEVYSVVMNTFDCLPVAALVTNKQGTFFCVHGGLSPDIVQLEDIYDFDRFVEPPEGGPLCDLLWSDPIEDCTANGLSDEDMEEWFDIDYVPNPTRGCGYIYGYAAVASFLESNNLLCVIRAHEVQKEGYNCHYFWKRDLELPLTITVFSAPNYCDMYGNQAGFIKFEEDEFEFGQIDWVDHPYTLPNFMNAVTYSLPFAIEAFVKMSAHILESLKEEDEAEEELLTGLETDEEMRAKVEAYGKIRVLIQKIRLHSNEIRQGKLSLGEEVVKFENAIKIDRVDEMKRPNVSAKAGDAPATEAPKEEEVVVMRKRTKTIC